MPTTFYNLTVTIDEDDPKEAYEILGDLIDQPAVRTWTSDTYSIDKAKDAAFEWAASILKGG